MATNNLRRMADRPVPNTKTEETGHELEPEQGLRRDDAPAEPEPEPAPLGSDATDVPPAQPLTERTAARCQFYGAGRKPSG